MPNYAALKAALATGGAYAGMTDAATVAACNAATVPVNVDLPMSGVLEYFALAGKLPTIQAWGKTPPSVPSTLSAQQQAEAIAAAQTFAAIVGPPPMFDSLQMSVPATNAAITAMVTALVAAGLITAADQAATLGAAVVQVSQASLWGWPGGIIENDIVAARAMP